MVPLASIALSPFDVLTQISATIEAYDSYSFVGFGEYEGKRGPSVSISKRPVMYVMTRWFPPASREDLV